MFDRLDFVYQPSRNVAADLTYYVDTLGAEVVFTVERFDTRVAMLGSATTARTCCSPNTSTATPPCSCTGSTTSPPHGNGSPPPSRSSCPFGDGLILASPAPQRIAVDERTQADRGASLTGRRDF